MLPHRHSSSDELKFGVKRSLSDKAISSMGSLGFKKTKGGAGDKEEVYVVGSSTCLKLFYVFLCIAVVFLTALGVTWSQNRAQGLSLAAEKLRVSTVSNIDKFQKLVRGTGRIDMLTELQSSMVEELEKSKQEKELAQQASQRMGEVEEKDNAAIESRFKKLKTDIEKDINKILEENLEGTDKAVDKKLVEQLRREIDSKLEADLQEQQKGMEKEISNNFREAKDGVESLMNEMEKNAEKHSETARERLPEVVKELVDEEVDMAEQNSEIEALLNSDVMPEKVQMERMMKTLKLSLSALEAQQDQRLKDLYEDRAIPDDYSGAFIDKETSAILKSLKQKLDQSKGREYMMVGEQLKKMAEVGQIPPPLSLDLTIHHYLRLLIEAAEYPAIAEVDAPFSLMVGRFTDLGKQRGTSFELQGLPQGSGLSLNMNGEIVGQANNLDLVGSEQGLTLTLIATNGEEKEQMQFLLKVEKLTPAQKQERLTRQRTQVSTKLRNLKSLGESFLSWNSGEITVENIFNIVREMVKKEELSAHWLIAGAKPIRARSSRIDGKAQAWFSDLVRKIRANSVSKEDAFARVMDRYNEGSLDFDMMQRLTTSLQQFNPAVSGRDAANQKHVNRHGRIRPTIAQGGEGRDGREGRDGQQRRERDPDARATRDAPADGKARRRSETAQARAALGMYQTRNLPLRLGNSVGHWPGVTKSMCAVKCDSTPDCHSFVFSYRQKKVDLGTCLLKDKCMDQWEEDDPSPRANTLIAFFKPCDK